jgi:tyrosyl-tRNA synthetase
MIGDPSGKSQERNLLNEETLKHNQEALKKQLSKLLDFDSDTDNKAVMVNNYDWMKEYSFIDFIREIGKHITVNYMMAKESVKKRISGEGQQVGMSFTEFSYQLVQGTDFLHLYKTMGCKLQMGGSDQWGNIVTGTELIRRKESGEAFALTCPLITKADGGKFGKTESGNVWLDPERTSPYSFYQFWLNVSDDDAEKYIKIFTMLPEDTINSLLKEHKEAPHLRILQKALAKEITILIHSEKEYNIAIEASQILFGKATKDTLENIDERTFLAVFEGVPMFEIDKKEITKKINIIDLLTDYAPIFASKGELRRLIKGGGVSLNKEKITSQDLLIEEKHLLNQKYILIQKGKKNYYLISLK